MKDKKNMKNGLLKKGLVLCLVGVMTFGMVACGSGDQKKDTTQTKVKTESNKKAEQPKTDAGAQKLNNNKTGGGR